MCTQPNKSQDSRELWKLQSTRLEEFKDQTLHRRNKNLSCWKTIKFTNTTTISKNRQAAKLLLISPTLFENNTFQNKSNVVVFQIHITLGNIVFAVLPSGCPYP